MDTFQDILHRKIERDNEQVGKEWLEYPAWCDMTAEQKAQALVLSDRQSKRFIRILVNHYTACGQHSEAVRLQTRVEQCQTSKP